MRDIKQYSDKKCIYNNYDVYFSMTTRTKRGLKENGNTVIKCILGKVLRISNGYKPAVNKTSSSQRLTSYILRLHGTEKQTRAITEGALALH